MPMSNRRPKPKTIMSGNKKDNPPLTTPERTTVEASELVIEIPDDDDSEASLVVLMRYMGCSTRTQHGRSYSFDSYAESEALFSDKIYGDSTSEEDIKPRWTMKNNEVGMKIRIRNAILACCSPASLIMYAEQIESPTNAAACTEKRKAKKTYLAVDTTEETIKSPKAAGSAKKNKVKKHNLTVGTTDEATMTSKKKGPSVGRPGYVISRTSYSNEKEVKTPEACMASTSKSSMPISLKPVWLIPRTPVGQAALRQYEEGIMSHGSVEKNTRKPYLSLDKGDTMQTKEKESVLCTQPNFSECNTTAVSPSADDRFLEAMAIVATNKALLQIYETELFLSPNAGSVKTEVRETNLNVCTVGDTEKKKGTVLGVVGFLLDEKKVTTTNACKSPKAPVPESLTTPVSLTPMTSLPLSSPKTSSIKSSTTKLSMRKSPASILNVLSTSASILTSPDTVGTTEETKKTNKKESTVVASPGFFIDTTAGCSLDEEEFNTLHTCMATSQSSALKSLTPVWSTPRTPAGQAALRQYEEELMSHESVEKNTRKPYLGTTGETRKTKKKESTVVASPGFSISPTAEPLQGVSPSAERVRSTLPNFWECNTIAVSPSADDRFLEEAMAIVATNKAFLSPKAGSVKTKAREPNLNVGTVGETEKKMSEKKGTVLGVVECLLDEKEVTTSNACKSVPTVPESLTTPVSLTPMTSLPLSSPKMSSNKSSTTKSPASILNVQSTSASIPSHFFAKLEESFSIQSDMEESLSTRNDKENSGVYNIHQEETTPLADNTASVVEPMYSRKLASTPSSGDRNVVCEVNDLLYETRERRVSHNKSQERTLVPPSPKLSSPRNIGVDHPLMASAPSERKIMGSISFNSPPNSPTAQLS